MLYSRISANVEMEKVEWKNIERINEILLDKNVSISIEDEKLLYEKIYHKEIPEDWHQEIAGYVATDGDSYWFVNSKFAGKNYICEASPSIVENLNLSSAIEFAKLGYKIARMGWNGNKDVSDPENIRMFVVYVPESDCSKCFDGTPYKEVAGLESTTICAHLDLKTPAGTMQPGWLAAQPDMLANDWVAFK